MSWFKSKTVEVIKKEEQPPKVSVVSKGFSDILSDNNERISKIEEFKNKSISKFTQVAVFMGGIIAMLFVAGMFLFQVVTGVITVILLIVGIASIWFLSKAIINYEPVMQQKLKNIKLKLMYEEAQKNAIYQLDNHVLYNTERLKSARKSRDEMGAYVQSLATKLKQASEGNKENMKSLYEKVDKAYSIIQKQCDLMADAFKKFETKVLEYKEYSEFSKVANKAMDIFSEMSGTSLSDKLSLEAFKAIDEEFNLAVVSIENLTRDYDLGEAK